jgi:hypothetical protein
MWFEIWRCRIEEAVSRQQTLLVYYFENMRCRGKIASWQACAKDALRRDSFKRQRQQFLQALSSDEMHRLALLSGDPRDDSKGERPGSPRDDAQELLFMASLSEDHRAFLEGHKGLGNSQKAEVCNWNALHLHYSTRSNTHAGGVA